MIPQLLVGLIVGDLDKTKKFKYEAEFYKLEVKKMWTFTGKLEDFTTEELKEIIIKYDGRINLLSSVAIQNEINIREKRRLNLKNV